MSDDGFIMGTPGDAPASPIADLTYRTYDGPLHTRAMRWWIVALSGLRATTRMKGFWIVAAIALLPYLRTFFMLYFESLSASAGAVTNNLIRTMPGQRYATHFFQSIEWQSLLLLIIALVAGSGCIARDNQANALLVYLSKPITKGDYIAGKWTMVFLSVYVVCLVPALVLYLYCLLSYYSQGFLKEEPWLILRLVVACAIPAAVHASLTIGFSAWAKTARMAGASYAGLFFFSYFVTTTYWAARFHGAEAQGFLERHMDVTGIITGLVQNVLGVTYCAPTFSRRLGTLEYVWHAPPRLPIILGIAIALCALSVAAARLRIRAVEVVRG